MPRSKRTKLISLTRTKPKTRDAKGRFLLKLKTLLSRYTRVGVVTFANMNSAAQLKLRAHLGSLTKIVFGKKTLFKLALKSFREEACESMEMLSDFMSEGQVALIFSNQPVSALKLKLDHFSDIEFAQPGTLSPANVTLDSGDSVFKSLSTSNDDYLRKLGLDVTVENGRLCLVSNFLAARKGSELTSDQCKLLKLLGIKLGRVSLTVRAVYDKESFRLEKFV